MVEPILLDEQKEGESLVFSTKRSVFGMVISVVVLTFSTGCGDNPNPFLNGSDGTQQEAYGDLPSRIGDGLDHEPVVQEELMSDFLEFYPEDVWQELEYEQPTGKWFFADGGGILGYGLTVGEQKASSSFEVVFIGHKQDGEPIERDVRIQLTERDGYNRHEVVEEETVYVEKVDNNETIYTGELPDKENVAYLLSAEILSDGGEVEDTRISYIYVPIPEMNVSLEMDQRIYSTSDNSAILQLHNEGPIQLLTGKSYAIEKKEDGEWQPLPLEIAFNDIGIEMPIGSQHRDVVDISEFHAGEYRVLKSFYSSNGDGEQILAAEFTIE